MNGQGKEEWYFESHDTKFEVHPIDSHVFWTSQLIACGYWVFFAALKVMSFNIFYSCLTIISFSLSAINLYGFYRCSKGTPCFSASIYLGHSFWGGFLRLACIFMKSLFFKIEHQSKLKDMMHSQSNRLFNGILLNRLGF